MAASVHRRRIWRDGFVCGRRIVGHWRAGNSQFGRLLGQVGGSLWVVAGASGRLFGSGISGRVCLSNPITAIIGGVLVGGALLFRFFADRNPISSEEVQKEYQPNGTQTGGAKFIPLKKRWANSYLARQIWQENRGWIILHAARGKRFWQIMPKRLDRENNRLSRRLQAFRSITDPNAAINQFPRFATGGFVDFPRHRAGFCFAMFRKRICQSP